MRVNPEFFRCRTKRWYGLWGRAAILAYVPAIKVLVVFLGFVLPVTASPKPHNAGVSAPVGTGAQ